MKLYRVAEIVPGSEGAFPQFLIHMKNTYEEKKYAKNRIFILKNRKENKYKEYIILEVYC